MLHALEVLPVAPPPPPRQLTEEETQKLEEQEENTLRELRLFLRDVTNRLSQDKRFKAFTKPVDLDEVAALLNSILSWSIGSYEALLADGQVVISVPLYWFYSGFYNQMMSISSSLFSLIIPPGGAKVWHFKILHKW